MDITMEMIEQVLDATGTDYYTAKEALREHEGNVEKAIETVREKEEARKADAAASGAADETDKAGEKTAGGDTDENRGEASGSGSDKDREKDADHESDTGAGPADPVEELFSDEYADRMVNRLKERVKEGNVNTIRISRKGKTLLEVPVNVGMLGGLFGLMTVPWAMILGLITAYGMNCRIEIITPDGKSERMM